MWEYLIAYGYNEVERREILNRSGQGGWELASVVNHDNCREFYFKRKKHGPEPAV